MAARGEWTLVALPDTQIYARMHLSHFEAQVDWVLAERDRLGIVAVLHEGDVVDDGSDAQWAPMARALRRLDGAVPYVLALGNHDYGPVGCASDRTTRMHEHLPFDLFAARPSFAGSFEPGRADNTAHRFETPDGPWLVIALEFGPRASVVAWARGVIAEHRGTPTVLLTHAYLYSDQTRYDIATRRDQKWSPHFYGVAGQGEVHDGEALYRALVEPCPEVRMVLSGHVLNEGAALLTDRRPDGSVVHQMLANYQHDRDGGIGFLRILRFVDAGRRVHVRTYSPVLDADKTDPRNRFELDLGT